MLLDLRHFSLGFRVQVRALTETLQASRRTIIPLSFPLRSVPDSWPAGSSNGSTCRSEKSWIRSQNRSYARTTPLTFLAAARSVYHPLNCSWKLTIEKGLMRSNTDEKAVLPAT